LVRKGGVCRPRSGCHAFAFSSPDFLKDLRAYVTPSCCLVSGDAGDLGDIWSTAVVVRFALASSPLPSLTP